MNRSYVHIYQIGDLTFTPLTCSLSARQVEVSSLTICVSISHFTDMIHSSNFESNDNENKLVKLKLLQFSDNFQDCNLATL